MENKTSLSQEHKNISILFTVLFTGIILFAGVSLALNRIKGPFLQNEKFAQILMGVVITLAVIGMFLAHFNYNKSMRSEMQTKTLAEKLTQYRSALTKFMSFIEGPAILSIIGFMLTGNFLFLAVTVILLLNMLLKRPSKMRIISELQLSSVEQSEL